MKYVLLIIVVGYMVKGCKETPVVSKKQIESKVSDKSNESNEDTSKPNVVLYVADGIDVRTYQIVDNTYSHSQTFNYPISKLESKNGNLLGVTTSGQSYKFTVQSNASLLYNSTMLNCPSCSINSTTLGENSYYMFDSSSLFNRSILDNTTYSTTYAIINQPSMAVGGLESVWFFSGTTLKRKQKDEVSNQSLALGSISSLTQFNDGQYDTAIITQSNTLKLYTVDTTSSLNINLTATITESENITNGLGTKDNLVLITQSGIVKLYDNSNTELHSLNSCSNGKLDDFDGEFLAVNCSSYIQVIRIVDNQLVDYIGLSETVSSVKLKIK
jgi:hypothetical protein